MFRDWTPYELYTADQYFAKQGKPLRNTTIYFTDAKTKKTTPLISDEEKKIGATYPNLSFLFSRWFGLYKNMSDKNARDITFALLENALTEVISRDSEGEATAPLSDNPIIATTSSWFYGNLDPHFYYREHNDEAFADFIKNVYLNFAEKKD